MSVQYFVIEGIDMSGKTTQCKLLEQNYSCVPLLELQEGDTKSIVVLREPGSTELGNLIRDMVLERQIPMDERSAFLLFLAQRAAIFSRIQTLPNTVIADRSLISGIAYAHHAMDMKEALWLNLFATRMLLPQKIVFLEVSKMVLQERMKQKKLDSIESKGIDYLMQVQECFKVALAYLESSYTDCLQEYCDTFHIQLDSCEFENPQILRLDAALPKAEIHARICGFFGV